MSDFQQVASDVRGYFMTSWDALSNGVPTSTHAQPENDSEWKPPVDSNGEPEHWIRMTVEPADYDQGTFGAPTGGKYTFLGSFIVEIFAPIGSGSNTLDALVSDAQSILRGQKPNDIWITDPRPVLVGVVDDVFYKKNVEATLRHFETAV